ncbi:MAG: NUDIX domain-containing protein [Pelagimonas sp.]|jgi:8-oxo-dGTP diphosphatase|nr:NUDIX domain-containing protein [Pelagimonas sp.]
MNDGFHGAKVMLFIGPRILVLRRDHTPGIPWPGGLDLPGGGREGCETPVECVIRETREEVGIALRRQDLIHVHRRQSAAGTSHFFAAHLPKHTEHDISFGNEGIGWWLMTPQAYVAHPDAIPPFAEIVRSYLANTKEKTGAEPQQPTPV